MGYMTDGLTLNTLRNANVKRAEHYKNAQGDVVDCSDWPLSKWMNALLGELGEAANIIKKVERGDYTLEEGRDLIAEEFADVLTYLDLTAHFAGINLGKATIRKWNAVSKRVGSNVRIDSDGSDWRYEDPTP